MRSWKSYCRNHLCINIHKKDDFRISEGSSQTARQARSMCHGVVNNTFNLRKRSCRHTSDHAPACGNPSVKFLFIVYEGEIGWSCFKESCIKETGLPANCRRGTTMVANFCLRYGLLLSAAGYKRPRFKYFTTTVQAWETLLFRQSLAWVGPVLAWSAAVGGKCRILCCLF